MTAQGAAKPKRQKLDESWKVHRRALVLDGHAHTVLSVRPGDPERFATNYFHDTWHIVSDVRGGRLIGRLCWALAFQKKAGTIVLIDHPNLVTNPFDGDPSWPVVIVNTDLGVPSRQALRQLSGLLPQRSRSEGTVKLATFGLERSLQNSTAYWDARRKSAARRSWDKARVARIGGLVVFAAKPDVLEAWGMRLSDLGRFHMGMDYEYLAEGQGEVQIFRDFHNKVERVAVIRASLFPGREHEELDAADKARIYELDVLQETARIQRTRQPGLH